MKHVQPKAQSSTWLATELLKRTDVSSGDICMFHYPMDFFPQVDVDDMSKAFELIMGINANANAINNINGEANNNNNVAPLQAPVNSNAVISPAYMSNATVTARNQINRIQFSWYQFTELPRDVLGLTYSRVQHLDIRQNASLTCIDSLISQLPNLASLNLSDCPNIRTLAPLAIALEQEGTGEDFSLEEEIDDNEHRTLSLRHLWVRGCNLSSMSRDEWAHVFDSLAESSGPLERLTLSRNKMSYLHENVGKLKRVTYLFVEDNNPSCSRHYGSNNPVVDDANMKTNNKESSLSDGTSSIVINSKGFEIPDELGNLTSLRFVSFCGNGVKSLPRTMGRLNDSCDVYLHRNPNLTYPPPAYQRSIKLMRQYFHEERMALLRGAVLFMPHLKRALWRANERLYRPGGRGYSICKERFEESVRRTSITLLSD